MKLLIDCDGCLTDGTLTIDHKGEKLFKRFHTRDVRAIREFVYNGWEVTIVTGDDWPGIHHFADKVGAEVMVTKDKSQFPFKDYYAIGDDAWDVVMLRMAKRAFCPNDADVSIRSMENVTRLATEGGKGVVAEVLRHLLIKPVQVRGS